MEYVKKKFVDEENRVISWFSTDDNVLCNDGKTLREKLDELSKNISSGGTVTVDGCNITYISPQSFDEFVELTKEGGLFYSLTSFPIVYNDKTYNVVGFIDSRPHSNGYSYYAFHKMWQFLINPDTKAVTSFSSFAEFIQKKIPSDASKLNIVDTNNNFTSTNVEGALEEVATQCKNVATKTIIEGNKLYLAKNDGTKIDVGTTLPSSGTSTGGSSENEFRLIRDITLTEDVALIEINTDEEGNPFELTEYILQLYGYGDHSSNTYLSLGYKSNTTTSRYYVNSSGLSVNGTKRYGVIYCKSIGITIFSIGSQNNSSSGFFNAFISNTIKPENRELIGFNGIIDNISIYTDNALTKKFCTGSNIKIYGR